MINNYKNFRWIFMLCLVTVLVSSIFFSKTQIISFPTLSKPQSTLNKTLVWNKLIIL